MKALIDELNRSMEKLKAQGRTSPYFMEFYMYENDDFSVGASLGAINSLSRRRGRNAYPSVRVGSYNMDNTNFQAMSTSEVDVPEADVTFEPDYFSLRRALWLQTDAAYKRALEALDEKKAYLLEKNLTENLDDFSKEAPVIHVKPLKHLDIDCQSWSNRTRKLSEVFREYDFLYDSWVAFDERVLNTWLINSEGTRVRMSEDSCRYLLYAGIRAPDGMLIADQETILARQRDKLPPPDLVADRARNLAVLLKSVADAPLADSYEGPVLFEDQAACEFFAKTLDGIISAVRPKVNMPPDSSNSAKKVGKRIMPVFISLSDDPLVRTFEGQELLGAYDVDPQGVPAQKVVIVENGILKTLLSSRTPTQAVKRSNGHGFPGDSGSVGCSSLFVESKEKMKRDRLISLLKKLGREQGLDFVYIVRRLATGAHHDDELTPWPIDLYGKALPDPVLIYKVSLKDGKETLVRGARFAPLNTRVLKDIVATGAERHAFPCEKLPASGSFFNVVAPSILIREMEIEPVPSGQKRPPLLDSPLKEKGIR